jgi:hypothetical protein
MHLSRMNTEEARFALVSRSWVEADLALVLGVRPQHIATTKGVKPSSPADETALNDFEQACNRFEEVSNIAKDLKTQMTWKPP